MRFFFFKFFFVIILFYNVFDNVSKYYWLKCKVNKVFFKLVIGIVFEGYLKIVLLIKMIVDIGFVWNEEIF